MKNQPETITLILTLDEAQFCGSTLATAKCDISEDTKRREILQKMQAAAIAAQEPPAEETKLKPVKKEA